MHILGFETTGPIGSVAIIDLNKCTSDGQLESSHAIKMKLTNEPMSHLKFTADLAKELLNEIGMEKGSSLGSQDGHGEDGRCQDSPRQGPDNLVAIAASIGPGSFTGIRIGVTLARSMGQALGIPVIAVPTLEVFRERVGLIPDNMNPEEIGDAPVAGILNARRGQVYGCVYGSNGEEILKPGPYMLSDVLEITDKFPKAIFYGDGVNAYKEILCPSDTDDNKAASTRILAPEDIRYQSADLVVKIAARKYLNGDTLAAESLMPDYMRLAEAEQKLKDGTLARLREEKMARFIKNI